MAKRFLQKPAGKKGTVEQKTVRQSAVGGGQAFRVPLDTPHRQRSVAERFHCAIIRPLQRLQMVTQLSHHLMVTAVDEAVRSV